MQDRRDDPLPEERQNLKRALEDIEAAEAAGEIKGNRKKIRKLILRIAEIDRMLGDRVD